MENMCSYQKTQKSQEKSSKKDAKTMAAMSKEFIKIEFVQQPKKEKATELRFVNALWNYNKIFSCYIYQTILNIKSF